MTPRSAAMEMREKLSKEIRSLARRHSLMPGVYEDGFRNGIKAVEILAEAIPLPDEPEANESAEILRILADMSDNLRDEGADYSFEGLQHMRRIVADLLPYNQCPDWLKPHKTSTAIKCMYCKDTGMVAMRSRDGQYAFAGPVPDDAKGYRDADCWYCDSGRPPYHLGEGVSHPPAAARPVPDVDVMGLLLAYEKATFDAYCERLGQHSTVTERNRERARAKLVAAIVELQRKAGA